MGHIQAHKAGATIAADNGATSHQLMAQLAWGVRADRSPKQVNATSVRVKPRGNYVRKSVPIVIWGPFVDHWIRDGMSAEVTQDALCRARTFMRMKAKGFSLKWRMRYFW